MKRRTNEKGFLTTTAVLVAAVCFALTNVAAATDGKNDAPLSVEVGIKGVYKSGFRTPVVVRWDGDCDRVELETLDSDGTPFVASRSVLRRERETEFSLVLPKATAPLTVRRVVENEDGTTKTAEKTFGPGDSSVVFEKPASAAKPIYLVVGDDEKIGLQEAFGELRWSEERRPTVVLVRSLRALPTDWRSYEAVDKLIITTTDPEIFKPSRTESFERRIAAMRRWCERGGDVVLLAGEKSVPLLKEGGALSFFSPGAKVADATHEFRVVNSLLARLHGVKNLAMTGSKSAPYLRVPVVSELKPNAIVDMLEAETPLFVERPIGLGTISFFAADLSTPPFSNWSGRGTLWLKILGIERPSSSTAAEAPVYVKRGYDDLSGQLRSANDVFEGLRAPSFALALILIFVYLLAIGPLDWFLAKKVVKRPSVTWATFPAFVLLFCALAVWATKASRPSETRLNQIDLLDVDVESGVVRDTTWLGVYSPNDARRDLTFAPGAASVFGADAKFASEPKGVLAPLTLSGDGVGAAEQRTFSPRVWDEPYSSAGSDASTAALSAIPFPARSSKSFVGRWTGRLEGLPVGDLRDDGLGLRGTIVNPFDVPIYSAFVVYSGGAYSLGTLAPGETKLDRSAIRQEPRRVLNEHRSSVPTARAKNWDSTDYNAASRRVPYVLRAASFYELGGGSDSFGLEKRLQGDVDLSDLVRCGRAVVYGTVVDPEAEKYRLLEDDRPTLDAVSRARANAESEKTDATSAVEKHGLFGSSDSFVPTVVETSDGAEARRTVCVRLILPLSRGFAPGERQAETESAETSENVE
ncbi:MAG: hypothetical protein IKU86_12870 [Thermoguttaceae bacterium]|nr:hypothetical protein [Thermoguttaceae bacterium]